MIYDVLVCPLKIIHVQGGDVLHAMKRSDSGFCNFGEAYFSSIRPNLIKGWKRHHEMILNLIVPVGKVRFILFDDREGSASYGNFQEVVLGRDDYCRLTVPAMVWVAFQGISDETSIVLNVASIEHSTNEVDTLPLGAIAYDLEV